VQSYFGRWIKLRVGEGRASSPDRSPNSPLLPDSALLFFRVFFRRSSAFAAGGAAVDSASAANLAAPTHHPRAIRVLRCFPVPRLTHRLRPSLRSAIPRCGRFGSRFSGAFRFRRSYSLAAIQGGEIIIDRDADFFHRFRANAFNRFQLLGVISASDSTVFTPRPSVSRPGLRRGRSHFPAESRSA